MYQRQQKLEKFKKGPNLSRELFYFIIQRIFYKYADKKKTQRCVFPISNSACYSVLEAAPATSDLCENLC